MEKSLRYRDPQCRRHTAPLSEGNYDEQFGGAFWKDYRGHEKGTFTWDLFPSLRCIGRAAFGALGTALVLDTDAPARLRPDDFFPYGDKKKPFLDCLHPAAPGLPDTWSDLLLSALAAPRPVAAAAPPPPPASVLQFN